MSTLVNSKETPVFSQHASQQNACEIDWEIDLVSRQSKISGSADVVGSIKKSTLQNTDLDWLTELLHKDDKTRVQSKFATFIQNRKSFTDEDVFRIYNARTSEYLWVQSQHSIRRNENGIAVSIAGKTTDIFCRNNPGFELSRQREQYEFLIQKVGNVVFTLDKDALCTFFSQVWYTLSGYKPDECIGQTFIQFVSDDHVHLFWKELYSLLDCSKSSFDIELQLTQATGKKVWVRIIAKTTFDKDNSIDGFFGTIENIDDKYNANLQIKESNERIKAILDNSKEIIITINLDEKVIADVNEAISLLGYHPEEWIGDSYEDWNENQRQKFLELIKLAVQSELQVQNQQIIFSNKTNTESIPFEFSTSIFYFKEVKYLMCVLRDIRERLKYEEKISLISTQLTHLINNIEDVYAIYDIKSRQYDFVSDNVEKMYGCSRKSYIENTSSWKKYINKEDLPVVEKEVKQIMENNGRGEIFYRINTALGEKKMLIEKLVVGKDIEGNADKLYIVKTDYTNIDNAEQSLMETERKFRFISENLSDFISIHDTDWNFTYASPSIKNILGYEPDEVLGLGGFDLVYFDDLLKTIDNCVPIVLEKKETRFRYRMIAKKGGFKWVETYSKPVIDSKGEITSIICSTRDVTDQVNAEIKLRKSEEQYRLISENSNDIIGIHNLQRQFTYISPSCRQVLGFEPQELIGKTPEIFYKNEEFEVAPDPEIDKVISGLGDAKFIRKVITKSGEEKLLEIWLKPVIKNDQLVALQSASRDVTEREKLLRELEQSLARERELNDLRAKFVSTASHQFRTPLTVIQSGVEIMDLYLEDIPKEKQVRFEKQFKKIHEEVGRLEHLMNDVLLLGRSNAARTPYNPVTASLTAFCSQLINDRYNNRFSANRQILFSVKGVEVPISFDPKLLAHAIENILSNAYKYSNKGNVFFDIAFAEKEVTIKITDTGIGIPDSDIKNLFQPFYRAINSYDIEGTGLGLSIVKEFIEKNNGRIFLESELNKGTAVSVILPVA